MPLLLHRDVKLFPMVGIVPQILIRYLVLCIIDYLQLHIRLNLFLLNSMPFYSSCFYENANTPQHNARVIRNGRLIKLNECQTRIT